MGDKFMYIGARLLVPQMSSIWLFICASYRGRHQLSRVFLLTLERNVLPCCLSDTAVWPILPDLQLFKQNWAGRQNIYVNQ